MARRFVVFVVFGVGLQLLVGLVGCGRHAEAPPELGVVLLTTTVVPADVQCISLTAVGATTVTRNFDVVPAQPSSLTATGLPTGTVTLTEMAYNVPCAQVVASTPPTWVSEGPVTVQLVPGQAVPVTIVLRRAGQAIITSTFADNVDGGAGYDGGWDGAIGTDLPIAGDAPKGTDLPVGIDLPVAVDSGVGVDLAIGSDLPVAADAPKGTDLPVGIDLPVVVDSGVGVDLAIGSDLPVAADAPKGTDLPLGADLAIGSDLPVGTDATVTPTTIYQINCGSSSAVSPFAADAYSSGGTMHTVTNTITTTGVTKPAPAAVYQSERYGTVTYTFPSLVAAASYTVRLHFAELYQTATGKRVFNIAINGTTVLSNFDIYSAAGGQYKAVVREFTTTANASGQIVLGLTTVTDNATISGIEIIRN